MIPLLLATVSVSPSLLPPTIYARRRSSRLSGDISTAMLGIGHGELRAQLIRLGPAAGVRVVPVTEEFSSRLCGGCGCSHCGLGAAKVFVCPSKLCKLKEERDGGGE